VLFLETYHPNYIRQQIVAFPAIVPVILRPGFTYTYTQFRGYSSLDSKSIPNYIFRMARFTMDNMPKEVKEALDHCMAINPEYIQVYFSDHDCALFIEEYYPQYAAYYQSVVPGAFRSDICRLLLLEQFGGVYNDIGHTYVSPLKNVIKNDTFVIVLDLNKFGIYNSFMASTPRHPLLQKMIQYIMKKVIRRDYGEHQLDITGPHALHRSIDSIPLFTNQSVYTIDGIEYGIKVLQHVPNYISDGSPIIQNKFKDYGKIMYTNDNIPHYSELWSMGLVYQ